MNMIWKKLREKNGASIFMGLMFLLVCLTVGTVVLTASTAAAGKLAEQQKREQDYLNVASAARLVKDRICNLTYTHKQPDGSVPPTVELTASDGKAVILEEDLKKLCNILAESTDPSGLQAALDAEKKSFEISFSSAEGLSVEEWDTVYGSLRMMADGRLFVVLWLGDSDKDKGSNHMTLEFCPEGPEKKTEVTGGVVTSSVVTTTCKWPESGCTITRGELEP